ncbi:MAG TPA: YceI family protein [Vicinamibacterales bacterium]|jgi:polyisoprenoid-binding protein YceI|nr:YceI family protein [Vicinamibacterales bacterium]
MSAGLLSSATRALLILCVCALPQSAGADQDVWTIQAKGSEVRIHVRRGGLLSAAGHEHEVIAPAVTGKVRMDPQRIEQATIDLTFNASALKVSGKGEPPDDVPKVQETMLSENVLDVAKYPTIAFRSRQIAVENRAGNHVRLRVVGDLTLHGVSRQIESPVDVNLSADRLTATGTLAVSQTQFGIKPVSAGLGTVKVKDEVTVSYTFTAHR